MAPSFKQELALNGDSGDQINPKVHRVEGLHKFQLQDLSTVSKFNTAHPLLIYATSLQLTQIVRTMELLPLCRPYHQRISVS